MPTFRQRDRQTKSKQTNKVTHDLPVIHPKCASERCTHHPDLFFIRPGAPILFVEKAHDRYDGAVYGPYVQKKSK